MSTEDSNTQDGQPSWVTADPTCPLAAAQRDSIRAQLTLWELCAPDGEDFVPDVATGIAAKLSITAHAATRLAAHGWLLARWPGFQRLFHTLTIPVKHMVAVLELTEAVDDEYQSAIESEIIALLTPEHPGQQLPSVRSLNYWVRTIIERIQPNARPLEEGEELRTEHTVEHQAPEISFDNRANSRTTIFIGLPKADGILVEKSLRAVASAHGCSVAEALVAIIREKLDVQVTLNLYKNTANPTEDIFAEGSWLPKAVGTAWLERVTHLAAPGYAESAGYCPSEAVKAAVAGRDGGCRAPGCTKEPYLCDVDHVHRYDHDNPEAGGPTSTANLHLLCRYHHKLKTAGVLDVELRPDGSECWTSVGDGHQTITTPYGPLGRETFERRHVRRTKALHTHHELTFRDSVEDIIEEALKEKEEEALPF